MSYETLDKAGVKHLTIDPRGDLLLVLEINADGKKDVFKFRVNSAVLCLASSVFCAMLGPGSGFEERKCNEAAKHGDRDIKGSAHTGHPQIPEILLHDAVDPGALEIALLVIHLQNPDVPTADEAGYEKLYQLAIICNKYNMKKGLLCWFKQITIPLILENYGGIRNSAEHSDNGHPEILETILGSRWLFMAFAFGDEDLFYHVSEELIKYSHIEDSGTLVIAGCNESHPASDPFSGVPSFILDEIKSRRAREMSDVAKNVNGLITRYSKAERVNCKCNEPLCDATMLGFLLQSLCQLKHFNINIDGENITTTITTTARTNISLWFLISEVKKIKLPAFLPGAGYYTSPLDPEIKSCCSSPRWPLKPSGSTSQISQGLDIICANCLRPYRSQNSNHAQGCSAPLGSLIWNLDFRYRWYSTGLEYSELVHPDENTNYIQDTVDTSNPV